MTVKPEPIGSQAPVPAVEAPAAIAAGLVDFGPPAGTRKRLFEFAKRSSKTALGPTRSEFGCD